MTDSGTTRRVIIGGNVVEIHFAEDPMLFAADWTRLYRTGHATAFQDLDWSRGVADLVRLQGETPLFVRVGFAGQPAAAIYTLRRANRYGLRALRWLDRDLNDYAMPLFDPHHRLNGDLAGEVWPHVVETIGDVDVVDLGKVPVQIDGIANPLARLDLTTTPTVRFFGVTIAGTGDDPVKALMRHSTHRDYMKFSRRLDKAGPVRFARVTDRAEADRVLDALFAQRRARFGEIGRFNLLADPAVEAFHRAQAARSLDDSGPVRLFALMAGDAIVATAYGLERGKRFYLTVLTMEGGEWSRCSPGILVTARTLEWAAARGLETFDFTIGFLSYKTDFGALAQDCLELLEPVTARGQVYLALRARGRRLKSAVKDSALFPVIEPVMKKLRVRGTPKG
jgi:CelD/BcsL family acetyltransferase involved in cellulose biosynthesis